MDFVGKDGKDQYGHGEHVAGIIAASGKASSARNATGRCEELLRMPTSSTSVCWMETGKGPTAMSLRLLKPR